MSTDLDPTLLAIFAQAEAQLDDDVFAKDVMRMVDSQRRKTMLVWSALVLATLGCFALLATPVITAISMATDLLPASLVDVENDWIHKLLAPVNSVAAALALGMLVIHRLVRRLFG